MGICFEHFRSCRQQTAGPCKGPQWDDVRAYHAMGFLGRIVQNLTPCKRKIFEETFGRTPAALGTYCCAQFVVGRSRLMLPEKKIYDKLLAMLDDEVAPKPECSDIKGHSTHCLMYETIWHVLWGEADLLPLRGENAELPLFLRARDVDNESYLPVGSQYMTTIMSLTTEDPNAPPGNDTMRIGGAAMGTDEIAM
eukprot:g2964.t1